MIKQHRVENGKIKHLLSCLAANQEKIALGIALIAYALSLLQYVQIHDARVYNSDMLYLPALFQDLTEWGGHLFEWRLTPAPYFFPDMLVYFAFASTVTNWHLAYTFSIVAHVILFTGGWAFLGRYFFTNSGQRLTYAAFVLITSALLLMLPAASRIIQPQFSISSHFGVMALLPYALGLALRAVNGRATRRRMPWIWAGLILLSGLLAMSDALAYAQIILPLLLAVFFLGLLNKATWRIVGAMAVSVGAAVLLAYWLRLWLIRYRPFPFSPNTVETMGNAFTELMSALLQDWQSADRLFLLFLLAAMGIHAAIALLSIYHAARRQDFPASLSFLSLFSLASILLTAAAVIVTSLFQGRGGFRYLFPLTVLPVYTLLPVVFYALRYLKAMPALLLLLALLLTGWQARAIAQTDALDRYGDYYPPLVTCVDAETARRGLRSGVGTYWDAKYISVLSKTGVKVLQATSDLSPYVWINNPAWYGRFPPQFALFNPDYPHAIDVARLINLYGYPQEVVDCDTRELWVYNRPEDARFQSSFADNPMAVNWCPAEVSADIPAYVWQIPKGAATPIGAMLVTEKPGPTAAGHIFQLPAGQYQLDMYYEYEGGLADEQIAADLFVGFMAADDTAEIDWRQYPLPAGGQTEPVMFNTDGKRSVFFRLDFRSEGTLTLHRFQLQKQVKSGWPGMCR